MYENTPKDAKIFNWWDEGHWITFFGGRKASTDNSNSFFEGDQDFAKFVLEVDTSKAYDLVVKKYDADYIVLSEDLFGKLDSMKSYAIASIDSKKIAKFYPETLSFGAPFLVPCNVSGDAYLCSGARFKKDEFEALPVVWNERPKSISVQSGNQVRNIVMMIYRTEDKSKIYLLTPGANKIMIGKLWFKSPEISGKFELAYESPYIKIFKVLK
jgi:hypothetical protein